MVAMRKRVVAGAIALAVSLGGVTAAQAQFNLGNIVKSAKKVVDATSVSDEQMNVYFDQMAGEMDSRNPVAGPGTPYAARLAKLTSGLNSYDGLNLDIKAYLVNDVNAFAMGNGTVRVYAGLMDAFNDDEIRCVIGHEIGHVKLQHGQKRMRGALQRDAAISVASTASNDARRIANSEVGKLFGNVITAQHSQGAETSADDYAIGFMRNNGYDPLACATAMDKLAAMSGPGNGGIALLQTHPRPAGRAKRMRKQLGS